MSVGLRAIAWIFAYLLASALVTYFFEGDSDVVLIWPPAAVAFSLLLIEGPRWWPVIALSVTVMHLTWSPVPVQQFIAFSAAANTLGALGGYATVKLLGDVEVRVLKVRTGFVLVAGAAVLAAVSAAVGVLGLWHSSMLGSGFWEALAKWFMGDMLGLLALTPAIIMVYRVKQRGYWGERGLSFASAREKLLWALAMLGALALMLTLAQDSRAYALGLSSLPLALLLWSALRFEPPITAIATSALVLCSTILAGRGFAGYVPPSTLLESTVLLVFMSLFAVIPLVVAATTFETRVAAMALFRRATVDRLTRLPNRAAFEVEAQRWLADRRRRPAALAYVDLDQFKIINDSFSHAEGDALVQQIAALLKANLGSGEYLARIGGDEFALLLDQLDPEAAVRRCQAICRSISDYRHAVGKRVLTVTASVGLTPILADAHSYADLLSRADAACFTAKELGGNRVQLSDAQDQALAQRTTAMDWAVKLKEALEYDRIALHCQSIVPIRTGQTAAATARSVHIEILLRMHGEDGDLMPGQVVHAAERFGLATRLDQHMISRCLDWFASNPDAAARVATVSINLSAHSLSSNETIDFIRSRLERSPLPPGSLCFEITETSAISDLDRAQQFISQLRALGCRFALDDFGTGFCSFAYLSRLEVDYYKIDGSFVREVENSPLALSIVRSMAEIGRSLGKQTVAEYVETEAIRKRIALLGVDYAQGFAIDRPQPLASYFDQPQPSKRGVA